MDFFSIDNMQRGKQAVHIAQAVFIFVSWCIMIAVFHNALLIVGGPAWYFALCFLTIPPLIYLTLTPIWERSRKWGNPYAFAILDVVYTILWLSAFASVASYNSSGLCFGACDLSKACVGLGFFIFLFFCLTSAMSIYGVIYFRREGVLPGASRMPPSSSAANAALNDPDREAFSTAPHDDDEYAPVHTNDGDRHRLSHHRDDNDHDMMHHEMDGGEGSAQSYDPTSYSGGGSSAGTEYTGVGRGRGMGRGGAPGRVVYAPPTVSDVGTAGYRTYGEEEDDLEHGGYDGGGGRGGEAGRVRFPAGNYN